MILTFSKCNNFWIDSGLIGLYKISLKINKDNTIKISIDNKSVRYEGNEEDISLLLHNTYDYLLDKYYNVSTQEQIEKNAGFYYDTNKDEFIRFPKSKPLGISSLIFSKRPVPSNEQVKYIDSKLPSMYSHIQEKHDKFIIDNKLKPNKSLLINGRNLYKPSIDISLCKTNRKEDNTDQCIFCNDNSSLNDISGTSFPLMTGYSGIQSFFHNQNIGKICWKCGFVSKFVPFLGFYIFNGNNYNVYLPYSTNLESVSSIYDNLNPMKYLDDKRSYRNFEPKLGGYFYRPSENLFSFLYYVFEMIPEDENQIESLLGLEILEPIEIYILNMTSLGESYIGKDIYLFENTLFIYRLLYHIEKENKIKMIDVMRELIDYDNNKNESKTLIRDKICKRILNKQSIIDLVEKHIYSVKSLTYFKPLHDFTIIYEKILRSKNMDQNLIDVAVSMGKRIGRVIDKKGELYRLRKTRTIENFLSEISRIQMKYDLLVESEMYNRGENISNNFLEFKQFFMMAVLNSFNAKNKKEGE